MRRYLFVAVAMMAVFLALFGLATWLEIPLLTDPSAELAAGGLVAAGVGVGLLVADVLLPVPSSLVMTAHGAVFGVAGGVALSLLGSVGAAVVAFALGRRGGPLLSKLVGADRARGDALLARYGGLAIVATRPLPLLAETVALLAGTSPMRWRTLIVAAVLGNLPPALLYALTGATAASLEDGFLMFGGVLAMTGVFWWVARRVVER
ncbi:MAG: TVP38/TMEM64 family protein [Myxococcales bacterium]|nr:TVP38/TMEM64 family protein [Myxococcales bacterium]